MTTVPMLSANDPARHPRKTAAAQSATLAVLLALTGWAALPAAAATDTPQPIAAPKAGAKTAPAAKPAKPATPRQQLKSEASSLALATATVELITDAQLDIAARVLTGSADCEFNQQITVLPVDGQPGHFSVNHKKQTWRMVPQETQTGAVRLEDKAAGIVWLQIPTKSMLMNAKIGQRLVDACTHSEQRAALAAVTGAANSLGIVRTAAPAAAASAAQ